jgi:hypothetical protein
MKIYGPYMRKDNRMIINIVNEGKKTSMSYPKYLMEKYLGRPLESNEVVHHCDWDESNNDIENLELMLRKYHSRRHMLGHIPWNKGKIFTKHGTSRRYKHGCRCDLCVENMRSYRHNYYKRNKNINKPT